MIGLVILNWNTRDFVLRCLESVYADPDSSDLRLLVVDAASSDDSVASVRATFPHADLLELDADLGFAGGNNAGAEALLQRHPELTHVCFFNADVRLLESRTFARLRDAMDKRGDVGIASPRLLNVDGTMQPCAAPFPSPLVSAALAFGLSFIVPDRWRVKTGTRWSHSRTSLVPWVKGAALMVRRDVWEELNGFSEPAYLSGEDLDFCWRARLGGYRTLYVHDVAVEHFDNAATGQMWTDVERAKRVAAGNVAFVRQWWPRQLRLVALMTSIGCFARAPLFYAAGNRTRASVYVSMGRAWLEAL